MINLDWTVFNSAALTETCSYTASPKAGWCGVLELGNALGESELPRSR